MKTRLFQKDFTMVVVGQIISLFGNNILRYALPLYLLNKTGSASLYGLVLGLSFLPMVVLSPIGGMIADRVSKRNIMVCLDFFTALLMLFYALTYEKLSLVPLLVCVLMLLYGIQGAYQPAVQSSLPVLVSSAHLLSGNAVINGVNSFAGIIGPVLGGFIFGFWGLRPILYISIVCFTISAVMEIFIHIPFEKRPFEKGVVAIVVEDMKESCTFIKSVRPEIGKVGVLLMAINLVFSALIIIGLPVIINNQLGFTQSMGNRLYGYAEGALAVGGLVGAAISGSVGKRMDIRRSAVPLFLCTFSLVPIGIVLLIKVSGMISFFIITLSCTLMMSLSMLFSIRMITYMQKVTPTALTGKVMALITCLVMCANPLGQAVYGSLFEHFAGREYVIYFGAFFICIGLCYYAQRIFQLLDNRIMTGECVSGEL